MQNISRAAAIVGVAEADEIGYLENRKSDLQLNEEACYNAIEDAGLNKSDVDGLFAAGNTLGLAEHMGIHPKFTDSTSVGGSSFVIHAGHALAAIAAPVTVRSPSLRTAWRATRAGSSKEAERVARPTPQVPSSRVPTALSALP